MLLPLEMKLSNTIARLRVLKNLDGCLGGKDGGIKTAVSRLSPCGMISKYMDIFSLPKEIRMMIWRSCRRALFREQCESFDKKLAATKRRWSIGCHSRYSPMSQPEYSMTFVIKNRDKIYEIHTLLQNSEYYYDVLVFKHLTCIEVRRSFRDGWFVFDGAHTSHIQYTGPPADTEYVK